MSCKMQSEQTSDIISCIISSTLPALCVPYICTACHSCNISANLKLVWLLEVSYIGSILCWKLPASLNVQLVGNY